MIVVAFPTPSQENFKQQWEFVLSHFCPDQVYSFGKEGLENLPREIPLVLLAPTNGTNIVGTESLENFEHPEDVVYLFGSDSRHVEHSLLVDRKPDHLVYVETDTRDQMYSFVCWAVVAWDRRMKEKSR